MKVVVIMVVDILYSVGYICNVKERVVVLVNNLKYLMIKKRERDLQNTD